MDLTTTSAILLTASVLGVTHGIEPDHAAGIASLTSEAESSKLSAIVGMCFAVGHVFLVILWIIIAYFLLGQTTFPPVIESVGSIVLGLVLILLSGVLGVVGIRTFIHKHEHSHSDDGNNHAHFHLHLPISSKQHRSSSLPSHTHEHTIAEYLEVSIVGALFTLSPPLSMIAFISIIVTDTNQEIVALAVLAYAAAITVTMALIGAGTGAFFALAKGKSDRIHAISQIVSAVIVFAFGFYFLSQAISL
ncbi:hypothetical protein HYG81_26150 (plasmid) [Natrinema zhouii]|uniref:hypothetical protein n=1 Tax=Natrinema zhouii TaxID=1710539 RepID=UPI001CFFEB42|nr:hypothetical protein [Natrinema zhouii]UHQ99131.1 hypothetical protein HYG81_26150 [Natrinema zhouii]